MHVHVQADELMPTGPPLMSDLDLSEAFERMNHFDLFIKLMNRNRNPPVNLWAVIEKWFAISVTCVKCGDRMLFLNLVSRVRHGEALRHHYSLYMWMTLLRKLLPVLLAVICRLFAQVFSIC